MLAAPVLLIVAGLAITITGIGVGSRVSRRPRPVGGERAGARRGLACGVAALVGALTVVLGIADGVFMLTTGT